MKQRRLRSRIIIVASAGLTAAAAAAVGFGAFERHDLADPAERYAAEHDAFIADLTGSYDFARDFMHESAQPIGHDGDAPTSTELLGAWLGGPDARETIRRQIRSGDRVSGWIAFTPSADQPSPDEVERAARERARAEQENRRDRFAESVVLSRRSPSGGGASGGNADSGPRFRPLNFSSAASSGVNRFQQPSFVQRFSRDSRSAQGTTRRDSRSGRQGNRTTSNRSSRP